MTGEYAQSGEFGVFFEIRDSSAPITTFGIQGSTTVFDGTIFVSTDAYAVLTATDPVVDYLNSQVAAVYYRMDPSSSTAAFSVYNSSVPLSLGPHVFEYKSVDYRGNVEAVKTSTFVVTAGTVFKNAGDHSVSGDLLVGWLDSGAGLEVEASALNDYVLKVTSYNGAAMLSVDNIGNAALGGGRAGAHLDVFGGIDSTAILLRSGDTASSTSSVQIAMGLDGEALMRHAIRTEHGSNAGENRVDFMVWDTSAGSSSAIAPQRVLSLQAYADGAASFHVCPSSSPDVELEVSAIGVRGGGSILRAEARAPSSTKFKSHIEHLSERREDKAYRDVIGLKHAEFRYKSLRQNGRLSYDPLQPLQDGLIYEDVPKSIRGPGETVVFDERLTNVEMALKSAIRELSGLMEELDELEGGQ